MLLRTIVLIAAALVATSPAAAQVGLNLDAGAGATGNSSATVTTQQVLPSFDGPFVAATVLSGVSVRSAPTTHGSAVLRTLRQGDIVSVRCKLGWCELADNGGYTAQKFLSFEGGDSFAVVQPPAQGAPSTGDAPPVTSSTAISTTPAVAGNFDGLWTVLDASGKPGMPLILKQTDTSVTGTLQNPGRLAKITGDISGTKLNFTYDMLNEKGKIIASGSGFFSLGKGGSTLSGVLMLNGLVVSNVNATR